MTPSQIGVQLRDSQGVGQVRFVTGNKVSSFREATKSSEPLLTWLPATHHLQILRILKSEGLAPSIPEDLYHLIKKAVSIRKHLERNRKDMDSKVSMTNERRG